MLYLMDGIESAWISAGCLDTGLWSITGASYEMPLSPLEINDSQSQVLYGHIFTRTWNAIQRY